MFGVCRSSSRVGGGFTWFCLRMGVVVKRGSNPREVNKKTGCICFVVVGFCMGCGVDWVVGFGRYKG